MNLFDPKQKSEVQEFEVDLLEDLVAVLASIAESCPGCAARGAGIRFDYGLTVHNSQGRHIANIITKWDGK